MTGDTKAPALVPMINRRPGRACFTAHDWSDIREESTINVKLDMGAPRHTEFSTTVTASEAEALRDLLTEWLAARAEIDAEGKNA